MKRRRKSYSVDAVVRFFLQYYGIPTKQDVDRILKRMDRLEAALKAAKVSGRMAKKASGQKAAGRKGQIAKGRPKMTATEKVLSILRKSRKGVDVPGLKAKSGFDDKKIRNIIFRLSKQGSIKRIGRGLYAIR
ncbi:MAG: hypothetical protein PVH78_00365 [Deltaproteobacteria bacterium]|jgi:hypothetical protein